ncbi:putative signal transducing protein [Vibrio maritimus]
MKIFIGNNPPETHIVQQQLASEGIHCEVRGEGVFGLRGEVPFDESSLPYVWLFDTEQSMMAKAIIKQWQLKTQYTNHADWHCFACDELNEGQFEVCWNCQTPKQVKMPLT